MSLWLLHTSKCSANRRRRQWLRWRRLGRKCHSTCGTRMRIQPLLLHLPPDVFVSSSTVISSHRLLTAPAPPSSTLRVVVRVTTIPPNVSSPSSRGRGGCGVLTPRPCTLVGLLEHGEESIDFGDTGMGGGDDKTPNSSTARGNPSAALDPALLRLRPTNSSLSPLDLVRSAERVKEERRWDLIVIVMKRTGRACSIKGCAGCTRAGEGGCR